MNLARTITCLTMFFLPLLPLWPEAEGERKPSLYDMAVRQLSPRTTESESSDLTGKTGTDADSRDENGSTALMKAAKEGNDWAVRQLLKSGADVNARDNEGWTAIMYAVRYQNSSEIISLLRDGGASLRVRNEHNTTPLLLAAAHSRNPDILALLLEGRSGAEEEVFCAFIMAIEDEQSSPAAKTGKLNVILRKGVPVNGFFRGMTPLMYACKYNSSSLAARILLEKGADASAIGNEGKTAADYLLENPAFPHDGTFRILLGDKGL